MSLRDLQHSLRFLPMKIHSESNLEYLQLASRRRSWESLTKKLRAPCGLWALESFASLLLCVWGLGWDQSNTRYRRPDRPYKVRRVQNTIENKGHQYMDILTMSCRDWGKVPRGKKKSNENTNTTVKLIRCANSPSSLLPCMLSKQWNSSLAWWPLWTSAEQTSAGDLVPKSGIVCDFGGDSTSCWILGRNTSGHPSLSSLPRNKNAPTWNEALGHYCSE